MVKKKTKKKKVSRTRSTKVGKTASRKKKNMGLAIIGLILNIFPFPGIGSMVAGKTKTGIWQFALAIIGAIVWLVYSGIGFTLVLIAFVWGIVTGIKLLQESR